MTRAGTRRARSGGALLFIELAVGIAVVASIAGRGYGPTTVVLFVLCALAAGGTGYVLLRMGSSIADETLDVPERIVDTRREALDHEKKLLLQGIKEFEGDAATGKVDQVDYLALRQQAEQRAVAIISELKSSDDHYLAQARLLVAARLGRTPAAPPVVRTSVSAEPNGAQTAPIVKTTATRVLRSADARLFPVETITLVSNGDERACAHCGTASEAGARFCTGCGGRFQEVSA